MERNKIIVELYFINKMKQKDIAEQLNISKYIVSRVLAKDSRYKKEKEKRKEISTQRHNKQKVESIIKKRKEKQNFYDVLKSQHLQASLELSRGKKNIGNRAFRNWNPSIYRYDNKTRSYKLKSNIVATYDVPRKIKW